MLINKYIYTDQEIAIPYSSILIVGDSHPQKSLNPQLFVDARNISQTAEPYVVTYWKLRAVFEKFLPDTVIIGFAPHNISQFNDLKFSDALWSDEIFRRTYQIEDFASIADEVEVDYSSFYKVLWKQTAFYPKRHHQNYLGGYRNFKATDVGNCDLAIQRHYYYDEKPLKKSDLSIKYLDSLIWLCHYNKVDVVLVSNPVHHSYLSNIPADIINVYNKLALSYAERHTVFDQTQNTYPDSLYLNCDHLNRPGAERFTEELIKYLK